MLQCPHQVLPLLWTLGAGLMQSKPTGRDSLGTASGSQSCWLKITCLFYLSLVPLDSEEPGSLFWELRQEKESEREIYVGGTLRWGLGNYMQTSICPLRGPGTGIGQSAEKMKEQTPRGKQRWHRQNALSAETRPHSCSTSLTWKSSFCWSQFKMPSRQTQPTFFPETRKTHTGSFHSWSSLRWASPFWAEFVQPFSEITQKEENSELKMIPLHSHTLCLNLPPTTVWDFSLPCWETEKTEL